MSELQTSVEKVVAVTTSTALFSGLCLILSKYNTYLPYNENAVSLSTYATIGGSLGASLWYRFRN